MKSKVLYFYDEMWLLIFFICLNALQNLTYSEDCLLLLLTLIDEFEDQISVMNFFLFFGGSIDKVRERLSSL